MPAANRDDWNRLRDYVIARRTQLGMATQGDLARAARVSRRTVNAVERGSSVYASTLAGIERALAWKPGSARRILAGGDPEVLDDPPETGLREILDIPDLTEAEKQGAIALIRAMRAGGRRASGAENGQLPGRGRAVPVHGGQG